MLITCEHGGNLIPPEYRAAMAADRRLLNTHRVYDPGALELAFELASTLQAELHISTTTRLLVDLNRSLDNPSLFGPATSLLDERTKKQIIRGHYTPYRSRVEKAVARLARSSDGCDHVSVHSFTPVLRGRRRTVDIGILFDPARKREAEIAKRMARELKRAFPRLTVAFNKPYKGTDDGFTTHLRTLHDDAHYAGVEIEINQRLVRSGERWTTLRHAIASALADSLTPSGQADRAVRRIRERSSKALRAE